jgi:3-oxoacyl-[acyl-carrier protein] reductase
MEAWNQNKRRSCILNRVYSKGTEKGKYLILKEKVAIVTGGKGGIGSAIVKLFLAKGARVVVADYLKDGCDKNSNDNSPHRIEICVDVSSESDVQSLVDRTLAEFGTIDILVNVAGVQGPIGFIAENSIEEWIKTMQVNLMGTMLCTKAVLPVMLKNKSGKIINFSGGGATGPRKNFSAYATSKAAVVRFTETIAQELLPYNIQVNAVAPGAVNTNMLAEVLAAGEDVVGDEFKDAQRRKKEGGTPPELAAELVCFLASHKSDWLTGKLIAAPWDPWQEWNKGSIPDLSKSMYTLRRVDDRNIRER